MPVEVQKEPYNPRGEAEPGFCCAVEVIANPFLGTEKNSLLSFQQIRWSNSGGERTSRRITEVRPLCLRPHGPVGLSSEKVPGHVLSMPVPPAQRSSPASFAPGPPLPKERGMGA